MKTSDRKILKGYYWNHEAIRKDMVRLQRAMDQFESYTTADFSKISKWFDFHTQCILNHHHGEDNFFFPVMKEKKPQFGSEIGLMEHEHILLDEANAKLKSVFADLSGGRSNSKDELQKAVTDYQNLITAHLDEEEKIVELVVNGIPEEEILQLEEQYRKTMTRNEMSLVLPWIVDVMDEKDRAYFFHLTPFFVRWIYQLSARPKFERLCNF